MIISHPTGNANVRNAAQALAEGCGLEAFFTTIAVFESGFLSRISALPGLGEFKRRRYPEILKSVTNTSPFLELLRLTSLKIGFHQFLHHEFGLASVDVIYRNLDRHVAKKVACFAPGPVYCYEDGALETFRTAKKVHSKCLYDLPIGYWRSAHSLFLEESQLQQEWAPTLSGLSDSSRKLERKDEELRLADRIFVASTFTRRTLEQCPFPIAPISVVPYGADIGICSSPQKTTKPSDPLRILFVGGLGQRKGLSYLLEAIKTLGPSVHLTLIGRKSVDSCRPLDMATDTHRWIPSLPHEDILREMRNHDVFVFPSLFEGFGLVITEALSQGLPVITTPNTCGPDVISEGVDGFIIPIRDSEAIAEKIELLLRDRNLLAAMREAAQEKARQLTWANYRARLISDIKTHVLPQANMSHR
jgi:glycosyltransferase involved in cell wall biosynthesis